MNDCVFCREIQGSHNTNFYRLYSEFESRVIATTEKLLLMPCIGQLHPSHCLILTKNHIESFAAVDSETLRQIEVLRNYFLRIVCKEQSPDILIFEHGVPGPMMGGCGIYHAHLHLLIVPGAIATTDIYTFNRPGEFPSLEMALAAAKSHEAYLLVGKETDGYSLEHLDESLPSQFVRKRIAELCQISEWDWRQYGRQDGFIDVLLRSNDKKDGRLPNGSKKQPTRNSI